MNNRELISHCATELARADKLTEKLRHLDYESDEYDFLSGEIDQITHDVDCCSHYLSEQEWAIIAIEAGRGRLQMDAWEEQNA